jgi:hypothetical protein
VAVIGKALFDIDNEKRLDGNLYMLSGATPLSTASVNC